MKNLRECLSTLRGAFLRAAPWLALCMAGAFVLTFHGAMPWDSFLYQPLPGAILRKAVPAPSPDASQRMLPVHSFFDGMKLLGDISGKKVLLTPGLAEWPDERTEQNMGVSFGLGDQKMAKELFERLCMELGMTWRYDPKQDAILLDPKWKRDDSRPGRELAGMLTATKPVRLSELPPGAINAVGGTDLALDDWRVAFDALLSKPENLPSAGTLRLYSDVHAAGMETGSFPAVNLFAGKLAGPGGSPRILVLNGYEQMSNKSAVGGVPYYLFDENGRFVKGGVYVIRPGRVGSIVKVQASGLQGVTIDVGWGSFALRPDHFHFALDGDDLVLQGSTDSQGNEKSADETRKDFAIERVYSAPGAH